MLVGELLAALLDRLLALLGVARTAFFRPRASARASPCRSAPPCRSRSFFASSCIASRAWSSLSLAQRLAGGRGELGLLQLLADLLERSSSALWSASLPVEELLLERLHAAERLGAVEALVGDVVDELVELLDRRLRLVALVLLLICLRKSFTSSRSSGAISTGSIVFGVSDAARACAPRRAGRRRAPPRGRGRGGVPRPCGRRPRARGRALGAAATASSIAASMKGVRARSPRRTRARWRSRSWRRVEAIERACPRPLRQLHAQADASGQHDAEPRQTEDRRRRPARGRGRPCGAATSTTATTRAAQSALAPTRRARSSRMRCSAWRESRRICSIPCSWLVMRSSLPCVDVRRSRKVSPRSMAPALRRASDPTSLAKRSPRSGRRRRLRLRPHPHSDLADLAQPSEGARELRIPASSGSTPPVPALPPLPAIRVRVARDRSAEARAAGGFLNVARFDLVARLPRRDRKRAPSPTTSPIARGARRRRSSRRTSRRAASATCSCAPPYARPARSARSTRCTTAASGSCPAGLVEPDEDPAAAAARELGEELGFRAEASAMRPLGAWTFPAPGIIGERHLFFSVEVDPALARARRPKTAPRSSAAPAISRYPARRGPRALPPRRHPRRQDRARPAASRRRARGALRPGAAVSTRGPRASRVCAQALVVAQVGRGRGRRAHRGAARRGRRDRAAHAARAHAITPRRSKRSAGPSPTSAPRSRGTTVRITSASTAACDLVVTVGGDGTLLGASHGIGPDVPLLGRQQRAEPLGRLLLRRPQGPRARGPRRGARRDARADAS